MQVPFFIVMKMAVCLSRLLSVKNSNWFKIFNYLRVVARVSVASQGLCPAINCNKPRKKIKVWFSTLPNPVSAAAAAAVKSSSIRFYIQKKEKKKGLQLPNKKENLIDLLEMLKQRCVQSLRKEERREDFSVIKNQYL